MFFKLLIVCLILGFKFKNGFDISYLAGLFILFFINFKSKYSSYDFISYFLYLIITCSLLLTCIINSCTDESFKFIIKLSFYIICSYVVVQHLVLKYKRESIYHFISCIVFACFINSIVVIFQFFIPEFKNFIYQYSDVSDLMYTKVGNIRMSGLSGGGGALLGLFHSIGFLGCLILYHSKKVSCLSIIIITLTIFFSNLFIARTGIILSSVFLLFFFLIYNKMLSLIFYTCILAIVYYSLSFFVDLMYFTNDHFFFKSLYRLFLGIYGSDDVSKFHILYILKDMIIFPEFDFLEIIFGVGNTGRSSQNYFFSDIGFLRIFHVGGISLIFSFIFMYLLLFLFIFKNNYKYLKIFLVLVLPILFMEFKELVTFGKHILPLYFIIYFFSYKYLNYRSH